MTQLEYPKDQAVYKEDEHTEHEVNAAGVVQAEALPAEPFIGPEQLVSSEHPPPKWDEAKLFKKTALTKALRMHGPFRVETSEGPLFCEDGWVAQDARGYFYPIAADEFEKIYEPAHPGD